jgi:hypothetical protein
MTLTEETRITETEILSHCHAVHHKSHEEWPAKNSRVSAMKAMALSEVRINNIYIYIYIYINSDHSSQRTRSVLVINTR